MVESGVVVSSTLPSHTMNTNTVDPVGHTLPVAPISTGLDLPTTHNGMNTPEKPNKAHHATDDISGFAGSDGAATAVAMMTVETTTKTADSEEPPKKARKSKGAGTMGPLNKTYVQLCQEAIIDMADRTGSSLPLVKKWIAAKYPDLADTEKNPQFASRVYAALKNGLTTKPPKFEKYRASFKIAKEFRDAARAKHLKSSIAAADNKLKKAASGRDGDATQDALDETGENHQLNGGSSSVAKDDTVDPETLAAQKAELRQIADRLRRRRFPMEDTKLHLEDKKYGVKGPSDLVPRPYLPFFWHITTPLKHPSRSGKTGSAILGASKVENLDCGSRGLVPDLLQVYHFFRGDVHFTLNSGDRNDDSDIVPSFTLQQLIGCVDQVHNGTARKLKLIPPLLVHLFVTCLHVLLAIPESDFNGSKNERQLRKDFAQYLLPALSAVSWADVMYLYMDAMERYYSTDASRDPTVLEPLETDVEYLFGRTDAPKTSAPLAQADERKEESTEAAQQSLPAGYFCYMGDTRGSLYRAHSKLARQDPWLLTAEELMALLRALTDDILATNPAASHDMAQREDQMFELLKVKRSADLQFRKMRLAFEGPKRPSRSKTKEEANGEPSPREEEKSNGETNEKTTFFKPTVTRKQFESAKKAQEKASAAYEKGIRKLIARTEPVGYDRNHNAVYCFLHDPEILYIEDNKPPSTASSAVIPNDFLFNRYSWHIIETMSLLDQYTSSLDIRGRREHDLHEILVGPPGSEQSLRRFLHGDVEEVSDVHCKIEFLKERLEKARIKCDEEKGRRSGRLTGRAESELLQIQCDLDDLKREENVKKTPPVPPQLNLTGLDMLIQFETAARADNRRTRERKGGTSCQKLPLFHCSTLCGSGNIDGTGAVGILVSVLLELEERCESVASWERKDVTRSTWISRLENSISAWTSLVADSPAPPAPNLRTASTPSLDGETPDRTANKKRDSIDTSTNSATKRRKTENPAFSTFGFVTSTSSVPSIISLLKQPLLDLEERVADITNVTLAARDADLADENISVDGSVHDTLQETKHDRGWKKLVHKLRQTPARKHAQIRELLVAAIGAARNAHLPQVVAQLRSALLLFHPSAANECKQAVIRVLVSQGDFVATEDDDDSDDEGGGGEGGMTDDTQEEAAVSVLSAEAATLRSSLGGSEDASRYDWIGMVKSAKTLSRLASLVHAFAKDAVDKLEKIEIERDTLTNALSAWNKTEGRPIKATRGPKKGAAAKLAAAAAAPIKRDVSGPSEVWANVYFTDEICMAKAENYPWWPAKVCQAKDPTMASSLDQLNRKLVALIGEMGSIRIVHAQNGIRPFNGERIADDDTDGYSAVAVGGSSNNTAVVPAVEYTKEMRAQLDDCMTMARRIQRGIRKRQAPA